MPDWTEESEVPIRLRAFRVVAESTKNHDLERNLYIEERKAERGVYWRRYLNAIHVRPVAKAALMMAGFRFPLATLNPFAAPETQHAKEFRLSHGRSRHVRPAMLAWSSPARIRLRRRFRARAFALAQSVARFAMHVLWIGVMGVYWALSDYGRSILRPLVWLAITLPLFVAAFHSSLHEKREQSVASGVSARRAAVEETYRAATRQLAISNAIPFVGPLSIDGEVKKFLLCGVAPDDAEALKRCVPVAPGAYQFALIGQNLLSALLLFFFGLALRNYFKVK